MYVWEEGLRETTWEQDCFKFSLENRETTVVWCALEVDSMPLDQNVKTPVLRISSEYLWRHHSLFWSMQYSEVQITSHEL